MRHHCPMKAKTIDAVAELFEQRASRGRLEDLDDILANVPDVPPMAGDEK